MFFMDGISKLIMLGLISQISINLYHSDDFVDGEYNANEVALVIFTLSSLVHLLGQFEDYRWNLIEYFQVSLRD